MTDDEDVRQVQDSETATAADATVPEPEGSLLGPEIEQAEVRWQELDQANQRELMALVQMGAVVDPSYTNRLRLDTFISFIFERMGNVPVDVRKLLTLQFEVRCAESIAENLKGLKSEVRKAILTQGECILPEEQLRQLWQDRQQGNGGRSAFGRG